MQGHLRLAENKRKAKLLEEDGVEVIDGKVDLKKYGIEMI